jgi:hypothetical protein
MGQKKKHGYYGTLIYQRVNTIRNRCYNPKSKDYPRYGGKGIGIWAPWRTNLGDFCRYLDSLYPNTEELLKSGLTIDREDNSKGYEPGNIRIVDNKTQSNNRDVCIYLDLSDGRMTIMQASEKYGICHSTIAARYHNGLRGDDCIRKERTYSRVNRNHRQISYKGKIYTLKDLCEFLGIRYKTVHQRLKKLGKTLEEALLMDGIIYEP